MDRNSFNKFSIILISMIILGFCLFYFSNNENDATVDDYSRVVLRAPIEYTIVDCGHKCRDWIEFEYKSKVFKFYQTNPFYTQFEQLANLEGFLTNWFDDTRANQIYQVSFNRKVIIPFDRLYSINNFDKSFLFVLPLIFLFIGLGRLSRTKS